MPRYPEEIEHSNKYYDDYYEYKHVILPEKIYKEFLKEKKLLTQEDCIKLGIKQSNGWEHYLIYENEPHILLFRRPLGTDPNTGIAPAEILQKIQIYNQKVQEQQNLLNQQK